MQRIADLGYNTDAMIVPKVRSCVSEGPRPVQLIQNSGR